MHQYKVKLSELHSAPGAKINWWKIADMEDWCSIHVKGAWQRDFDVFSFENKDDSLAFIQTWLR